MSPTKAVKCKNKHTITSATEKKESRGKSAQVDVARSGPIAIAILCRSEGKQAGEGSGGACAKKKLDPRGPRSPLGPTAGEASGKARSE